MRSACPRRPGPARPSRSCPGSPRSSCSEEDEPQLIRKSGSYRARGSTGGAQRSRWGWRGGAGGAVENDRVTERFEVADVVAAAAVGVGAGGGGPRAEGRGAGLGGSTQGPAGEPE